MPSSPSPEEKLGDYIFKANPYAKTMEAMLDLVEHDYSAKTWSFKTGSYNVAKAILVPYCYTDKDGLEVKDYLLVGYAGSGGH